MNATSQLQRDALGLAHSAVMGVAGTAPSYSIAATTATLIGAVGILAPASLLYCGLIMFGITFAYVHLNRMEANAGATYAWVTRVFNHTLGFFAGWTVLVSSALFMVSATIPAAASTVILIAPEQVADRVVVTAVAALWLVAVSAVILRGIAITGRVQAAMTAIEIAVLLAIAVAAALMHGEAALRRFDWAALSPAAFDPASFSSGAVIALFFFWGWDVALNLNEETRDAERTPGLGAMVAMVVILCAFIGFSAVTLEFLTDDEIRQSSTNVIFAVADKLFPRPWSYLAVLAVMLSTIGTLETSILQFTRTLFAKSRAGVLHPRWARTHPRWHTPQAATLLIAGAGLVLLGLSLLMDSLDVVLKASIQAISVQAAYYYGLAGFACAWHYRGRARRSLFDLTFMVAWPGASALLLWGAAIWNLRSFDALTAGIAIGGILLGAIPLAMSARRRRALTARSS